jgi:hypothetical protein
MKQNRALTVQIYKLTDPRLELPMHLRFTSSEITHYCYVGMSKNPKQRLRHHLAYTSKLPANSRFKKWLISLKDMGLRPYMTILDICSAEEARQAELDCIAIIRAVRGNKCLNVWSARESRV